MTIKPYASLLLIALTLSACTSSTLEERLAGKTGKERDQELYDACIEHATHSGGRHSSLRSHLWVNGTDLSR